MGLYLCVTGFSLFFLIMSTSIQLGFLAQGRKIHKQNGFHQLVGEEKTMVRAQIGSRPPRCERWCRSCGHCEAIQVPTNPQVQNGKSKSTIDYARGDDTSNYKPMSWKCKCGNLFFNP
ncbi:hypothetical protein L6164_027958 [Bauhinia variegata]|uniref:Uncharacterized protein n=1 Tax=Bauhinia variegata TaxID=167791 RepID=A0ACB9LW70_BAUVA|nr:hypothetical protein L6164_027958 [Bauhinia variegata]